MPLATRSASSGHEIAPQTRTSTPNSVSRRARSCGAVLTRLSVRQLPSSWSSGSTSTIRPATSNTGETRPCQSDTATFMAAPWNRSSPSCFPPLPYAGERPGVRARRHLARHPSDSLAQLPRRPTTTKQCSGNPPDCAPRVAPSHLQRCPRSLSSRLPPVLSRGSSPPRTWDRISDCTAGQQHEAPYGRTSGTYTFRPVLLQMVLPSCPVPGRLVADPIHLLVAFHISQTCASDQTATRPNDRCTDRPIGSGHLGSDTIGVRRNVISKWSFASVLTDGAIVVLAANQTLSH